MTIAAVEGRFGNDHRGPVRRSQPSGQEAWAAQNVPRAASRQSGMIMTAAALLRRNRDPSDADIDAAMTNICRCGTYPRIREAIKQAARIMRGDERVAAAPAPASPPPTPRAMLQA